MTDTVHGGHGPPTGGRFACLLPSCDAIDPDATIQAMEVLTPPVGRKVSESLRQVQAFQHVRATKGAEACPAGWESGQPTLKPGPDLVGAVWKVWKPHE